MKKRTKSLFAVLLALALVIGSTVFLLSVSAENEKIDSGANISDLEYASIGTDKDFAGTEIWAIREACQMTAVYIPLNRAVGQLGTARTLSRLHIKNIISITVKKHHLPVKWICFPLTVRLLMQAQV